MILNMSAIAMSPPLNMKSDKTSDSLDEHIANLQNFLALCLYALKKKSIRFETIILLNQFL